MPIPSEAAYKLRQPASMLRSKRDILFAGWLVTLAIGMTLAAVLYGSAADPDERDGIVVEFRNLGAMSSAAGIHVTTDAGVMTILVTRDGYFSISSDTPDWRSFPHIDVHHNRLILAQGNTQHPTTLYINGERAWHGRLGFVRHCNVTAHEEAAITWIDVRGCA